MSPTRQRRMPNPWIAIPSLVVGLLAGLLGWTATSLSCTTSDPAGDLSPCPVWSWSIAIAAFLAVTIGMALVLVLVYRSLAEWREAANRNDNPD